MTKQKRESDKSVESPHKRDQYSYVRWVALTIVVLYFLPALGIVSKTSFWAFSVNTYFPAELLIAHLALVMIICISLFRPGLLRFIEKIPKKSYYIFFACAMLLMVIFLREKVPFYGDGYFFQRDIITGLPIKYAEVLTMLIYRAVHIALPVSAKSGATTYHIVNTTCVIPAVTILLYFTRSVKREYIPFVLFTFLGFGANVLFFGHVENYTLVYLTMLLYLYTVTRQHPNIPVLAFLLGISICLHLVALCLVPSFIYALWRTRAKNRFWRVSVFSLGFFVLPFVITILFSFVAGMTPGQLFTEVAASITTFSEHTGQHYIQSVINIRHWLDIFNLLFLGLPTFLVITAFIFIWRESESFSHDQNLQLILSLGIPFILFVLFFNTPLGLARDWDLGVTAFVWRVAAVIYLATQVAPRTRIRSQLLTTVGLLVFLLSLPWFVIQHLPQLGVRRFDDILGARTELPGTAYGYEILGRYYHDTEDYRNSVKNYEKAAQHDPENWRRYYSIAMEYLNLNQPDLALDNLRKGYDINPREPATLAKLGVLYHNIAQDDSALAMFQRLYQQDTADVANRHNLGCAYFWAGQYDSAYEIFSSILKIHPYHYNATLGLIDVLIATRNFAEAEMLINHLESRHGKDRMTQKYWKKLQEEQRRPK
ncbi:hypothetical protein AMJ87_07020 [candidate division WOR_3 bacterium SM23_60]|uniref:Uncharacterized protein n=1 Tax=candidate division WOR_3 bacterium SM23_60 TaxID=1703780 RepID=A0A0S8GF25_UNCW3|nr:MAG: hypothetical protein AMJ87_07020 [candidate division WOR_3 bacterium SM23_60]